jgi:monoamine oxidase
MNFGKFKENVKQLLSDKSDIYNFIENYSVSTQAKYNHLFIQDKTLEQGKTLVKTIVSLLDVDTSKMLFEIDEFTSCYELGDLYSLWKIIYIKLEEPIIIIGAGVSGLTVATGLSNDFLILEARDRIGGRVYTNDKNMDMGAAWIHGSENNPLNQFIDYNNMIPVANCNPWMHSENVSIKYLSSNGALSEEYRQQLAAKWNQIAQKIGLKKDKTIYEAFVELETQDGFSESKDSESVTVTKEDLSSFLYMIEVWCGGSVKNVSTSFLNEANYRDALFGDYGGAHYLFKNGAKTLLDGILNSSSSDNKQKTNIRDKIMYNQVVTDIVYNGNNYNDNNDNSNSIVTIRTSDNSVYYCSKLCITVPPGPLKDIQFSPPLDELHSNALSKIKMGSYKKIQLEFCKNSLGDMFANCPMILTYNPFILWNNYQYSKGKPILEAICPAETGWALTGQSDEELLDNMLWQLRNYYPHLPDPIA